MVNRMRLTLAETVNHGKPILIYLPFEAVRDALQESGVYFIFVANTGMFQQVIVPLPRVRSIFFDTPVRLGSSTI